MVMHFFAVQNYRERMSSGKSNAILCAYLYLSEPTLTFWCVCVWPRFENPRPVSDTTAFQRRELEMFK